MAQLREKMSRFIAFAIPVRDAGEAKARIKELTNEYHDARHVCWAYMIGPDREEWQLSDNGEPSGTAGKPILGQINSRGLTDTLIVVVRYFGGIKLGTPGLIAAYREAARLAIEEAGVKQACRMASIAIRFPYVAANGVMKIVKGGDCEVVSQEFDNTCRMELLTPRSKEAEIRGRLLAVDGVTSAEDGV
ncbi:MAG: YigZ family protein [Muribaculaceae bacterium]|nr:YigZ family protein [Muribaculaceae bacterium]